MIQIGYAASSEEHQPSDLVRYVRQADEIGFDFAMISDHYHPWTGRQGNSPFVWSVLGAIAQSTERIKVATGVTCPTMRIHPAIIAQASATVAAMMPGRFMLGVGTGENLNEHILGDHWPAPDVRLEMLEEAIEVIRKLWTGEVTSHRGRYYTVQQARLYTRPESPPPVLVAAKGDRAAALAARNDGLIGVAPETELIESFNAAGGDGKPAFGQMSVCWGPTEQEARRIAMEWWPVVGVPDGLMTELALPRHFEDASSAVREEDVTRSITCSPDPERHLDAINRYAWAGYDHIYIHQVGPDQEGFLRFYELEVLPKLMR